MVKTERKKIDWEGVERDYRAGVLTVREIAAAQGITHGAVNKRARRDGWDRDLSARIKAKADSLVSKALVSNSVSSESLVTERQTVEANSQAIANVRLAHRTDISRAKNLVSKLFAEVESATVVIGQDPPAEILTIPQRVDCVRKLTDSTKTLVALEREAWGIKDKAEKDPSELFDNLLSFIDGTSKGLPA